MPSTLLHRPARTPPPPVPSGAIKVTAPPRETPTPQSGVAFLQPLLPILGVGAGVTYMAIDPRPLRIAGGALFALGAVAMGLGLFWQQRAGSRKRTAADRRSYLEYLKGIRRSARDAATAQRSAASWLHPDPDQLWSVVASPRRVWERRRTDPDFAQVRIGVGPRPLVAPLLVNLEETPFEQKEKISTAAVGQLVERHNVLEGQPIGVPLTEIGVLSVLGARFEALGMVRALLAQLATFHAPGDVKVAVLAPLGPDRDWEWVKWLPHSRSEDPQLHDESGRARLVANDVEELAVLVGDELSARRGAARPASSTDVGFSMSGVGSSGGGGDDRPTGPHLVVVVDGASRDPALWDLLAVPDGGGLTVVNLVAARSEEPGRVDLRVLIAPGGRILIEQPDGSAAPGHADHLGVREAEALARSLAPLRLAVESGDDSLHETVGLSELLGVDDVATMDVAKTWKPRSTRAFLRVPIGVGPDGRAVDIDVKESALGGMGPHGLVIGATGSGKSEMLRTFIMALAINHPPELLSFVLVDFKGGATFAGLSDLPHTAGVITNLQDDEALIDRVHDALFGEMQRRQEALNAAGNLPSVREYQRRRAAGVELEPLPVLLVIIDEFTELLTQKPDFIDLFVAIGRLGRSLGMHLLFSSQRLEEGKLRGLESHLSYRIGLRTFSASESRAVLGVPDAYELPPVPGSGYLKVDTSVWERFKAAMVSSPYRPPALSEQPDDEHPSPFVAANHLKLTAAAQDGEDDSDDDDDDVSTPSVLDVAVARLAEAGERVHQVWVPPLDERITLDTCLGRLEEVEGRGLVAAGWRGVGRLVFPLGMLDKPQEQRSEVLALDLSGSGGNAAVVGGPQSGKSVLLRAFVAGAALTHAPTEVQLYCVDLGGGGLQGLAGLPHVGTVAGRTDPERVRRLVAEVALILGERERLFAERGLDSVQAFRALRAAGRLPDQILGDVFLVVDGWQAFVGQFEDLEPVVVDIARRGLGYGLHVVLSANRWYDMRPAVKDTLTSRLELRLTDPTDSELDRTTARTLPLGVPGRGITRDKLVFQAALPRIDGSASGDDLQAGQEDLVRRIAEAWPHAPTPPVRMLPELVRYDELPGPAEATEPGVAIGLGEVDLRPVHLDLVGGDPHLTVFGDGESGKTSFLRLLMRSLADRGTPKEVRFLVIDYRRTLLDAVGEDYLLGYCGAAPAAHASVSQFIGGLEQRLPPPDVTVQQLRDRSWWTGPECYVIVDDYDLVVTPSGNPLQPLLEHLAQGRDLGFHLVLARRVGGLGRGLYESVLQRVRELSNPALLLSGDPGEGALVGPHRAVARPPGRGMLVRRRQAPAIVQTAYLPEAE